MAVQLYACPHKGEAYALGVVVRDGHASIQVACIHSRGVVAHVAEWSGNASPRDAVEMAVEIGHLYNTAVIAVEYSGAEGIEAGNLLREVEYPAIYREKWRNVSYLHWVTRANNRELLESATLDTCHPAQDESAAQARHIAARVVLEAA